MAWVDITSSGLLQDGGVYQIGVIAPADWTAASLKIGLEQAPPGLPGGKFSVDWVTPGSVSGAVTSWRFQGTWHGSPVVVSRKPLDAPGIQYAAVFEQVPDPPPPPSPSVSADASTPSSSKTGLVAFSLLALGTTIGFGTYLALKHYEPAMSNPLMIIKTCRCGRSFTQTEWKKLKLIAANYDIMGDGLEILELRNCYCGSTLAVDVTPKE